MIFRGSFPFIYILAMSVYHLVFSLCILILQGTDVMIF
jgi:hypothetical protein